MPPDFELDFTPEPEPVDASFTLEPEEENLPAALSSTGLSTTPISLNLVPYEQTVALLTKEAKGITVSNAASQKVAISAAARNKKLYRDLEVARKRFVAPFNQHVKDINNLFKELQDPLSQNEATIKAEIGKYELKLELERRRQAAILREEQRKQQAALEAEARAQREEADRKAREAAEKLKSEQNEETREALKQEIAEETAAAQAPTPQAAPIVPEKAAMVRTSDGAGFTKFKWVCRIVDPDLVDRKYCEPSQKHLDEAVKGGVRNIPGCVIEEEAIPNIKI
jgi:hypothetical protein